MTRLGEVATYINGFAFKPDDWSEEGLPIIRIQDLTGNSYQMNRYAGDYNPKYEVNRGDVLISWSASLGVYVWQGERALLNQHIFKVVFDKCEVDKSFYVHQVAAILEKAASQAHGATMKHLTKPVFDALPFYLPDLPTQQRIADTLDKVSEGIGLCRKMLGKLDLMVKAKFGEMFGALGEDKFNWGMTTLGVCCELNPKRPRDIPDDMDVSFVAMPSVTEKGQIDTSVIKPYLEVRKGFTYFAENDVLFAKITPCMENGKGCVAKGLTNAIGAGSTEFHVLRPIHGKSNPYWLYYLTVIPGFRENARKVMTGTGGQLRVPIAYLDNLPVSLPPIELQEQFATFVSKIDKSRLTIQQVLSKMEMVKLALMQEYFG